VADPGSAPLGVSVWALWRGAEISGPGTFDLLAGGVHVRVQPRGLDLMIPFDALDGARVALGHLTLYPSNGDVVELSGAAELGEMGRHLRARACTLPELTLALRGLGSPRAQPGPDHDRYFGPLLAARRAAQRASDPAGRMAAMRGVALEAELERVLHAFAGERYPASPPDRRALEAELDDLAAPVRMSLRRLDEAARAVAAAPDDTAFVWWRAWAAECRALFAHADACWLAAIPALGDAPPPPKRFWRWPWRQNQRGDGRTPAPIEEFLS
jgi:hypothetical protein